MRIGSALLTVVSCLLTWRIGSLLLGPSAGLLGGLAMATCVWTAVAGRAATPDAPLLVCTTLAMWLFVRDTPAAWRGESFTLPALTAWGIGAACGCGILAKGPVGLVLPLATITGFTLWAHATSGWRSRLSAIAGLRLPLVLAGAVGVALPWYAWVTWRTDGEWLRGFLLVHNFGRFTGTMEGHSGSPLCYYPATIAVGFFPWSIVLLAMLAHAVAVLRRPRQDGQRRPLQLLLVWAAVWIGGFSCSGTKLPGYVWPAYPALAILCGAFLDGWLRRDAACVGWCRDPDRALGLVMRVAWTVLATAGLAIAVGLPAAACLRAPGEEWLGLIGLIPIAGALAAWGWQSAGMPARALGGLAVSACLLVGLLASVAADRFSHVQGMRSFAAEADAGAMRSELRAGLQVAKAQLSTAQAARRGLEARLQELAPTAPADGLLRWRDPDLRAGDWIAAREPVATLLSPRTWQVEAYLSESEIARIAPGSKARFYPDGRFGDPLSLTVASISHDATHVLPHSELAGVMGGTVAVREVEGRLIPEQAVYRVNLLATMQPAALAGQTWRGRVMVEAEPESLAERVGKAALALWWREAGW
jgi:4-amino-4-deoxy-L-arabinose transferase-like glycosyltransferase